MADGKSVARTDSHAFGHRRTLPVCKGSGDEEGRPTERGHRHTRTREEESVISTESPGTDWTLPQVDGRPSDRNSDLSWCAERSLGLSDRGDRYQVLSGTDPRISRTDP